jgi:hypothetical protein
MVPVEIDIGTGQVTAGYAVHVHVRLSSRELNRLYLAGDTLLQLPLDGLADESGAAPIPRTSIFLSELAGSAAGFTRTFVDVAHAESFARAVRDQLSTALEA